MVPRSRRFASPCILVVDDDDGVRGLLSRYLDLEGYRVVEARDASEARTALADHSTDLILLDVTLPAQDGFDFLSVLRRTTDVPVIMLTGRDDGSSRVLGLRLGADDYVVKPFAVDELAARIESVLRRTGRDRSGSDLQFDDLRIDVGGRKVSVAGVLVGLTAKEYDVLAFLASSPQQVFSRQQLLEQVWGSSADWQDPRTVTEHLRRVRQKLRAAGGDTRCLQTVRGVGYRFEP